MSEGNSDSGFLPNKIISSRNSSPGSLSPLRFPIEKDVDEDILDDSGRMSGRMSPGYASPGSFASGGSNSNIQTGSPENSNNNNNSLNAYGNTVRTSSNSSMNIAARRGSADMSSGFNSARSGPETKSRPSSGEDQRRRRRASRVFQEMEAELSARSRPNSGSNSRRIHPSN